MAASSPEPIQLDAPFRWTAASPDQLKMLRALQGNILKGHGRPFTANIFSTFGGDALASRRVLRDIANHRVTDAHAQLLEARHFKETSEPGGDFCHVALSFAGYEALEREASAPPDPDFRGGMRAASSREALGDPDLEAWEPAFREPLHAVVLAASESEASCARLAKALIEQLEGAGATVVHVQHGKQLFNAAGFGIEHFGYVDGRSQPLMLVEDIDAEVGATGNARWDPAFPLDTALVADPGVQGADAGFSFGSYFVFRKLEEHVRDFKRREQMVADSLGLAGDERELAGAMIVGRFEDGTPVTQSKSARGAEAPAGQAPPNDFDYDNDEGARCPFHGHIRKTNPRGSGGREVEPEERKHLMARRGITYEDVKREFHPDELPETEDLAEFDAKVAPKLPEGGVGLLFMAYNRDIGQQFKFVQQRWANADDFPFREEPGESTSGQLQGIDPVIGQGSPGHQRLPVEWDDLSKGTNPDCLFAGFVRMKGGEYFFSPSLTFLKNL